MTYQEAVNKLTNWQRNQWARDGYPGSGIREETDKVLPYLSLTKDTRAKAQREEERKG